MTNRIIAEGALQWKQVVVVIFTVDISVHNAEIAPPNRPQTFGAVEMFFMKDRSKCKSGILRNQSAEINAKTFKMLV